MRIITENRGCLSIENELETDFNPDFQRPGMIFTVSEIVRRVLPAGSQSPLDLLTEVIRNISTH